MSDTFVCLASFIKFAVLKSQLLPSPLSLLPTLLPTIRTIQTLKSSCFDSYDLQLTTPYQLHHRRPSSIFHHNKSLIAMCNYYRCYYPDCLIFHRTSHSKRVRTKECGFYLQGMKENRGDVCAMDNLGSHEKSRDMLVLDFYLSNCARSNLL